jgi:hypothetical protein
LPDVTWTTTVDGMPSVVVMQLWVGWSDPRVLDTTAPELQPEGEPFLLGDRTFQRWTYGGTGFRYVGEVEGCGTVNFVAFDDVSDAPAAAATLLSSLSCADGAQVVSVPDVPGFERRETDPDGWSASYQVDFSSATDRSLTIQAIEQDTPIVLDGMQSSGVPMTEETVGGRRVLTSWSDGSDRFGLGPAPDHIVIDVGSGVLVSVTSHGIGRDELAEVVAGISLVDEATWDEWKVQLVPPAGREEWQRSVMPD